MSESVLIIENSATEALRARLILERDGHSVTIASDGKQGLEMARTRRPDVIVLDSVMPGMSGYEIWERLKGNSLTVDIPVIILTTETGPTQIKPRQALGPNTFVSKPYQPALLSERIQQATAISKEPAIEDLQRELGVVRQQMEVAKRVKTEFLFDDQP